MLMIKYTKVFVIHKERMNVAKNAKHDQGKSGQCKDS